MREWAAERIAAAAGAELLRAPADGPGPERGSVDSRAAGPGELFFGIPGARVDGGRFAADALVRGAWGALVTPERAAELPGGVGAVLAAADPTAALGRLARAWRRELGVPVIGVTGSTGKTSTKDILRGVLGARRRVVASRENFNTEIGMPLEILRAPADTDVLVLELAMRGAGQIAELTAIAEPEVGVIVNVGPVHLELLGSIEAVAAAKAELVAGLAPGSTAVLPAGEPLLHPYQRADVTTVTFGPGGDVRLLEEDGDIVTIARGESFLRLSVPFRQPHQRRNLLAAIAAAHALGVEPSERIEVALSGGRGQERLTDRRITVIDDCYNANPMSMRAALDDLATRPGRRVAVLGDMLELGPEEARYHRELGAYAARAGVERLVTVGPLAALAAEGHGRATVLPDAAAAARVLPELLEPGDVVLVKGSRGVGLEVVCTAVA